jgi:hypothetical protein
MTQRESMDAFKRIRKPLPPPTKVKPGKRKDGEGRAQFVPDPHLVSRLESSPRLIRKDQRRVAEQWGCPWHGDACPLLGNTEA